ncbi:MAG TPA: peptidase C15 [Cyanobacteria bacterium UBA12227]|nr:peptidase C15 [Cyanobacteria bacterium UBA12227]HAX87396.1 peptidase C15 [Cyanobacteria bacterium UBA11370]HBY80500.1 peptidase C15 [Cyanobacteria bacterium UBA11148]
MSCKILLTSFQTWLPHQRSNSSDDLVQTILGEIDQFNSLSISLIGLRQLPVDVTQAVHLAIAKIEELQPDGIICCGMAERRTKLTVESCATSGYISSQNDLSLSYLSASKMLSFKRFPYGSPEPWQVDEALEANLLQTSVNLEDLLTGLANTEISHDAGKFVCEGLYYQVLKYLHEYNLNTSCIFVHVPVLTSDNLPILLAEFGIILHRIASFCSLKK